MLDWLLRKPHDAPSLRLGERELPVAIRRLPQARRMTMRLAPDGSEVRLSVPRWVRTAEAMAFVHSRQAWIEAQLARVRRPSPPVPGGELPYRGKPVRIEHCPQANRRPQLACGALRIGGPPEALAARLRRWLRAEAHALLETDLAEYCARAGKPVPRLALSGARRRWGSCAADGTIRINWRLIMAPDAVRRSVVAHEVAHLVHFDHTPAFHACLAALFEGDIKAANTWLKHEGPGLYAWFE